MVWYKEKVNAETDYDLINLDFSKIKLIYIMQDPNNKEVWNLSVLFLGDQNGYIIYQGTNVECMNIRNQLEQQINPQELPNPF